MAPLRSINAIPVNFGSIEVAGFDLDSKYLIESSLGRWTPALSLTQTFKYDVALRPGIPEKSYVSQDTLGSTGWAPRWKGNASLSWELAPVSASITGRYVGPYNDVTEAGGVLPHQLGNFWRLDTNLRIDLGKSLAGRANWLRDSYVTLGQSTCSTGCRSFPTFRWAMTAGRPIRSAGRSMCRSA